MGAGFWGRPGGRSRGPPSPAAQWRGSARRVGRREPSGLGRGQASGYLPVSVASAWAGRGRAGWGRDRWGAWVRLGRDPCGGTGPSKSWKQGRPGDAHPPPHPCPLPSPAPTVGRVGAVVALRPGHTETQLGGQCPPLGDLPSSHTPGISPCASAEPAIPGQRRAPGLPAGRGMTALPKYHLQGSLWS